MANFEYRTFILPRVLNKLGVVGDIEPGASNFLGNQFMQGEVSPENVGQLLDVIHPITLLFNLAGYQLEAAAMAAKSDDSSAAVYVNLPKNIYSTATAQTPDAKNALQQLIGVDFPAGTNMCLGLRLTPRPRWWTDRGQEQYFALPLSLDSLGLASPSLTAPSWLVLGTSGNLLPDATMQSILTPLNNEVTALHAAIADSLATEWASKSPEQRGGLLPYLNPDNWGDPIAGPDDPLRSQYQLVEDMMRTVYDWLESLSQQRVESWLTNAFDGSFSQTLLSATGTIEDRTERQRYTFANLEDAITTVFAGTHGFRDWMKYTGVWREVEQLRNQPASTSYIEVLMLLEELAVIDMLGSIRQTETAAKQVLPFDISGFYEQVQPDNPQTQSAYDFHTLQLNQAGIYAQGFWQERIPTLCNDEVNGGEYLRFQHYRFCLEPLGNQSYDGTQVEFGMQLYRWENTNFLREEPYLKLPADSTPEQYCNHDQTTSEVFTVFFSKSDPLPFDTEVPDADTYYCQNPAYGVRLEISTDGEPLVFARVSTTPYLAQADIIAVPEQGREDLVLTQRFPLHSLDKLRILAAGQYLIDNITENMEIFTSSNPWHTDSMDVVETIDQGFEAWLARYVCSSNASSYDNFGPQIDPIRRLLVKMLAGAKIRDDVNLEILTVLVVFLANNDPLMPYTRAILGDSLPAITSDMQSAVLNNTAGLHTYLWGTNGLGEQGQAKVWEATAEHLILKEVKVISTVLQALEEAEKLATTLSIDFNIFILDIEKISPLTDESGQPYPGWEAGEKQYYFAFQFGAGIGPNLGIYLSANSTQFMYSGVNWDPGDFSGPIQTYSGSAGVVFDTYLLPGIGHIDINSFIEDKLQHMSAVELLGDWLGFDANNLKLGFGLSMTIFFGNNWDGQFRLPIRSGPSFYWIDYSLGIAATLQANAVMGGIIHIPEFITGKQTTDAVAAIEAPSLSAVNWQVIEQNTFYQTFNNINVWVLSDDMKEKIRQMVAEYLACFRNRNMHLTINGHASPIGPEAYNLWLSQKRAQAVYDYIRSLIPDDEYAILPQNTMVQGYGEYYATYISMLDPDALAPEWQTVMVYLNGKLIVQIGEQITG